MAVALAARAAAGSAPASGSCSEKPNSAATRSPATGGGIVVRRTLSARRPSARSTVNSVSRSVGAAAMSRCSSRVSTIGRSPNATTISPLLRPAFAAGVSAITSTMTTPNPSRMPCREAISSISCSDRSRMRTPSQDHERASPRDAATSSSASRGRASRASERVIPGPP